MVEEPLLLGTVSQSGVRSLLHKSQVLLQNNDFQGALRRFRAAESALEALIQTGGTMPTVEIVAMLNNTARCYQQ